MFKLLVRTRILNAAAVPSGQNGAVIRKAEQAGCSRPVILRRAVSG